MNSRNIFFIGPASVGKSTVAKLLADKVKYDFVDIDLKFCEEIGLIPDYVRQHSYTEYCERNSRLVDDLLIRYPNNTVFATPSGFLVHEDSPHLVEKHIKLIRQKGISILLLPSKNPLNSVDIIIKRQQSRWDDVTVSKEKRRFIQRFHKYKNYGDIKIFSLEEPTKIATKILQQLRRKNLYM